MKRKLSFLMMCTSLVFPVAVSAQSTGDVAYCKKLSAVYRAYNEGMDPATDVAVALSKCNTAAAASIPVLEKALTADGMKLPKKM
jgi:hypothetical protein